MKILYAVQKTGNGHLARAQEIIPFLREFGEVDILASGHQSQLRLEFPVKYDLSGLSLFYSNKGRLSVWHTLVKNNYWRFLRDLIAAPVKNYDLIINDFEPVTAWAARIYGGNIVSLSHQASLWFREVPRPAKFNPLAYWVIKYYAPAKRYYGFHFKSYHEKIFTPVIREKIRQLQTSVGEKHVVYLPAYSSEQLYNFLHPFDTQWIIFTRDLKQRVVRDNCTFYPINENEFLTELASCKGVLCGAGFELPAESLYLRKKLFVIPIQLQVEQYFNEASLNDIGVPSHHKLDRQKISDWLKDDKQVAVDYHTDVKTVLSQVIAAAMKK